jgi:hypothetical protein
MNTIFQNNFSCNMMYWEIQYSLRNLTSKPKDHKGIEFGHPHNEIRFIVPSDEVVAANDVIAADCNELSLSFYKLTEIVSRVKSFIDGKDYIVAKTNWTNKKPDFTGYEPKLNYTYMNFLSIGKK